MDGDPGQLDTVCITDLLPQHCWDIEDVLRPDCGLLSIVADKEAFCTNLLLACNTYTTNAEQAEKGTEWALQKFSYTRLVTDMRLLYQQLLK